MPTGAPNAAPSLRPHTSKPTEQGDTNAPTFLPTSQPSWNTNYLLQQIYAQHLDRVEYYSKAENAFTFDTFYFKGVNPRGTCTDWEEYHQAELMLPFDYVYFSKMEMYVQRIDYGTNVQDSLNATCSNRDVIANILDALVSGDHYESICGEVSWRVFTCGGNRIICLNCKHNCVESEACPAASMSLNPCMESCNHYGAQSITVATTYRKEKF
jgi:hypothetical protein